MSTTGPALRIPNLREREVVRSGTPLLKDRYLGNGYYAQQGNYQHNVKKRVYDKDPLLKNIRDKKSDISVTYSKKITFEEKSHEQRICLFSDTHLLRSDGGLLAPSGNLVILYILQRLLHYTFK